MIISKFLYWMGSNRTFPLQNSMGIWNERHKQINNNRNQQVEMVEDYFCSSSFDLPSYKVFLLNKLAKLPKKKKNTCKESLDYCGSKVGLS